MPDSRKLPLFAAIVAFLFAAALIVSALTGMVASAPLALIPLLAGIGILRRRAWSAYGYALCTIFQILLLPLLILRAAGPGKMTTESAGAALIGISVAALFYFAGRSLTRSGAQRGSPLPWIAVALVTTIPLIFVQAFVIPTGSMENTLLVGDRMLVLVLPRAKPVRDDIVTFSYPVDRKQTSVKRIVGVSGDRLRVSNKVLYRNGPGLSEPWAVHKTDYEDLYRDDFPSEPNIPLAPQAREMLAKNVANGEVVVPAKSYFVMGNDRDRSFDSRYWGFITEADVIGKPVLIYDSVDQTAGEAMQAKGIFRQGRTRWNRLFKRL